MCTTTPGGARKIHSNRAMCVGTLWTAHDAEFINKMLHRIIIATCITTLHNSSVTFKERELNA